MLDGSAAAVDALEHGAVAGRPLAGAPVHLVNEPVMRKATTLQTPPEALAIFPVPQAPPLARLRSPELIAVYADGVGDPGNLGTLARAAAAFGASALATSPGSADLYSPKVVRAGMGATFALALYPGVELEAFVDGLAPRHVYGLVAHGGGDLRATTFAMPAVLCVGAERAGLSEAATAHITDPVTIPLASAPATAVESLNAGVAGAIALYELARGGPTTTGATAPEEA